MLHERRAFFSISSSVNHNMASKTGWHLSFIGSFTWFLLGGLRGFLGQKLPGRCRLSGILCTITWGTMSCSDLGLLSEQSAGPYGASHI